MATSSSKELKGLLKAARSALDKEDYEEAVKQCEAVFWLDEHHYLAHVIAGKAHIQLKQREQAKNHYRKAVSANSTELLAWKGLADLYDKDSPSGRDEVLEAIEAYSHVLETIKDGEKETAMLCKLAPLYKAVGQLEKASSTFLTLLLSQSSTQKTLNDSLTFLFNNPLYSQTQWPLVDGAYKSFLGTLDESSQSELRKSFLSCSLEWIKLHSEGTGTSLSELIKNTIDECQLMKNDDPLSTEILLQLEMWNCIKALAHSSLSEEHITLLTHHLTDDEGEEEKEVWLISRCIIQLQSQKIKDACLLADRGVALYPKSCEAWFVSCACHMMSHDYGTVISNYQEGTAHFNELPIFLSEDVRHALNVLLLEALLLDGNHSNLQQAMSLSAETYLSRSHDSHVIQLYVRILIANKMLDKAEEILASSQINESPLQTALIGLLSLARQDYETACAKFESAVEQDPKSCLYRYWLGYCYWYQGKRRESYPSLIKSAQMDPFNPSVFLLLGHYQNYIANDLKRAIKCYQKAFSIQPGLTEAGMALGECLSATGEEAAAYEIYLKITEIAPPTQAREAWLRIGLYYRGCGQYDEAIKCFLKVLHQNTSDDNVWECLGEAYLSRGSHIAAMKAFKRAAELNPQSLYSQYQVAAIQQLIGQLSDAVDSYTLVLDIQDTYIPALKGRAESYYLLAKDALMSVLDETAVDYISLALKDLTKAIDINSSFVCLWKLVGDCCLSLNGVADSVARLSIPSTLLGNSDVAETTTKKELLQLGIRAYEQSLHLSGRGNSPYLLHNLAINNYHLARVMLIDGNKEAATERMFLSLELIKKAITVSPKGHTHWNALGVIAMHSIIKQYSLVQHAFIRSLNFEPNNAIAWSNLGALYLINDNIQLAHLTFERAQSCDPSYPHGWVGDGLVAEFFGKEEEAKNFFRIVAELQYHDEAALAYAYWICKTFSEASPVNLLTADGSSLSFSAYQRMIQGRDGILKYVSRHPNDPLGLNLLGILYEQEGLVRPAERVLKQAVSLVSSEYLPMILDNHARLLSRLDNHSMALTCYESLIAMGTVSSRLGGALALFRAGQHGKAKSEYQVLLDTCSDDQKPELLLALSMCLFAEKDLDNCKKMLFKVFQTPPPSLHGLISMAVFAGYTNDDTLLQATLAEILKLADSSHVTSVHWSCDMVMHSLQALCSNDEKQMCLDIINNVLDKLSYETTPTNQQLPHMSSILSSLLSQTPLDSLKTLQKHVHSHPGYLWVWPLIPYVLLLLGNYSKLTEGYLKLVAMKVGKCKEETITQQLAFWCKLLTIKQ